MVLPAPGARRRPAALPRAREPPAPGLAHAHRRAVSARRARAPRAWRHPRHNAKARLHVRRCELTHATSRVYFERERARTQDARPLGEKDACGRSLREPWVILARRWRAGGGVPHARAPQTAAYCSGLLFQLFGQTGGYPLFPHRTWRRLDAAEAAPVRRCAPPSPAYAACGAVLPVSVCHE